MIGFETFVCFRMSSFKDGRRMTYLPLLLMDELSFRLKDLMVGGVVLTNTTGPG